MFDWLALLPMCAPHVHPETMTRLVQHESKGRPWAIGVNGPSQLPNQPRSKSEAVSAAKKLHENGVNFDAGLGQLNSKNIARFGLSFDQAFDPCTNLSYSAQILQENYARALQRTPSTQAALTFALSAYNTGSFTAGINNGYVAKVLGTTITTHASISQKSPRTRKLEVIATPFGLDGFSPASIERLNAFSSR